MTDTAPLISICLPCRNTYPYLQECLDSIQLQKGVPWELIVCDGYSTDGSWELLQSFCSSLPSAFCFQSGSSLYEAWNDCIRRSHGSYIYIATSDDVLAPGALACMAEALNKHPDFGLCQIRLAYINEHSQLLKDSEQWLNGRLSYYQPEFINKASARIAPHDGVLMAAFHTVYESINQLLIRRSVFDRVGFFDSRFGSMGDFEWGMRVGLTESCIYLPQPVAYWRLHPSQVTQPAFTSTERLTALAMTRCAFARARSVAPRCLPLALLAAMEDFVYDDYVSACVPSSKGRLHALRFYFLECRSRPLLALRRLWRSWRSDTTTTFDYAAKQQRIVSIMRRFAVPLPIFES